MGAKHQKIKIKIPKEYSPVFREAIAVEVIQFIQKRTQKGLDKNDKPFVPYSKGYKKSIDFKIAGKSSKVDLVLSGDMLASINLLKQSKGELEIGFKRGTEENAKADGNIRGTYGQSKSTGKRRDFLGISREDLKKILSKYDAKDPKDKELAKARVESFDAAENISVRSEED